MSDRGGAVARIADDGTVTRAGVAPQLTHAFVPNGIALAQDGCFLIANIGDDGGVWRMDSTGAVEPFLTEIAGQNLPPTNFVLADGEGRIWISVSTRKSPRHLAYRRDVADGFIVRVDARGAHVVADGLQYTNETRISPDRAFLYVAETFAQRVSRFPLGADGSLGERQLVAQFPPGAFVDGIAFDAEGGLWVTAIVSNRIYRVLPSGRVELMLAEEDAAFTQDVEAALTQGVMGRAHFDGAPSSTLRNVSSLAFFGAKLDQIAFGALLADQVVTAPAPVPGAPPDHWGVSARIEAFREV